MKKLMAAAVAAAMVLGSTAAVGALEFGENTGYKEGTKTVVALYTGYTEYAQATMLAYDVSGIEGATAMTEFVDNTTTPIMGIDQKTADGTFEFPVDENYSGKMVLMVGGTDEEPIRMLLDINGGQVETITFICGDVNGDGVADDKDASLIMISTTGGSKAGGGKYEIGGTIASGIICGDVNGDGVADDKDASLIMISTTGGSKAGGGKYEIGESATIKK